MQWVTMLTLVIKRLFVFFYLNKFYQKYHDLEQGQRSKWNKWKRVVDAFLSVAVYALFFVTPKQVESNSGIAKLFIEIELISVILEPLFFEIYFPWQAKEKIEVAAKAKLNISKTKKQLNEAILSKVLEQQKDSETP